MTLDPPRDLIRFTATREAERVSVTLGAHSTADAVVASFAAFMLACGYHPDSIERALEDKAAEMALGKTP